MRMRNICDATAPREDPRALEGRRSLRSKVS